MLVLLYLIKEIILETGRNKAICLVQEELPKAKMFLMELINKQTKLEIMMGDNGRSKHEQPSID